jgi:hypothetical protein
MKKTPTSLLPRLPGEIVVDAGQQLRWLVIAGLLALLVLSAIWVSVRAAYENTKFSAASAQIVRLLGRVQALQLDYDAMLARQASDLIAETERAGVLGTQALPAPGGLRGVENPWGQLLTIQIVPGGFYRFASNLPAPACNHVVDFFEEQKDIGVVQIQLVPADNAMALPVVLDPINLSRNAISAACAQAQQVRMVIFFRSRIAKALPRTL